MQSDKNAARGGSGLGKGAMGKAADTAAGLGSTAETKAAGMTEGAADATVQRAANARADQRQEVWAYRERLEVEAAKTNDEIGRASVSVRVTEHPERFEVTRGHDEAVIRRADVQGDMVPGRHHEFVERSVEIPLFGEGNEVVVHKVSEPYAKCTLDVNRVAETQTFETTLRQEEIVENNPAAARQAAPDIAVREVEEGYELRERADVRERTDMRERTDVRERADLRDRAATERRGVADEAKEAADRRKDRDGRWF